MPYIASDPAELARPFAEELVMQGYLDRFEIYHREGRKLVELEREAAERGMLDVQYYVRSHRSMAMPTEMPKNREVSHLNFSNGLDFRGRLKSYSTARIGKSLGATSVRALCLEFDDALLLPDYDTLPEGFILRTPALAVKSIQRITAYR